MKTKILYTVIILGTLLIGIAIGFLANGRLTHIRMERMRSSFNEQGFHRNFERTVRATPEQMESIKPILDDFARKQRMQMNDFKKSQREQFDEFRAEIEPFLEEDQLQRLDKMHKRFHDQERNKKRRKHHRPPPK